MSNKFDWCGELLKLEEYPSCRNSFGGLSLSRQPQSESLLDKGLRISRAVLAQRSGGKLRSYGNTKPKKLGVCRYLHSGQCNLLHGGQICRRNNRLTRYCPFKGYFTLNEGGTISTRLNNEAYLLLLQNLRSLKVREISYG